MKNLLTIALCLFSISLTAQIDTTVVIDVSQNVSRSNDVKPFNEYVMEFRMNNDLSYATLAAWFSVIASDVHSWKVEYTIDEIKRMEKNEFLPFPKVQKQIIDYIKNY